jgi:hypothetical protein
VGHEKNYPEQVDPRCVSGDLSPEGGACARASAKYRTWGACARASATLCVKHTIGDSHILVLNPEVFFLPSGCPNDAMHVYKLVRFYTVRPDDTTLDGRKKTSVSILPM